MAEAVRLAEPPVRLRVFERGLADAPLYDKSRRAKSWCANITPDPTRQGGLERRFWNYARGEFYYVVPPDLVVPCAIEFGADVYAWSGNRRDRNRWYGVLIEKTADHLTLVACATALEAFEKVKVLGGG